MKYFKSIQSGVFKGDTYLEYFADNVGILVLALTAFSIYFSMVDNKPMSVILGVVILIAIVANIVTWGTFKKRVEL